MTKLTVLACSITAPPHIPLRCRLTRCQNRPGYGSFAILTEGLLCEEEGLLGVGIGWPEAAAVILHHTGLAPHVTKRISLIRHDINSATPRLHNGVVDNLHHDDLLQCSRLRDYQPQVVLALSVGDGANPNPVASPVAPKDRAGGQQHEGVALAVLCLEASCGGSHGQKRNKLP